MSKGVVQVEENICNNKLCKTYIKEILSTTKVSHIVQTCLDYWKCPLSLNDVEFHPKISKHGYAENLDLDSSIEQWIQKYNQMDKNEMDRPPDPFHFAVTLHSYEGNCPLCHCKLSCLGYGRDESYIEKTKYDDTNKSIKWIDYDRFDDYGSCILYSLGDQWMCGNCWKKNNYIAVKQWMKSKDSDSVINENKENDNDDDNKDKQVKNDEKYHLLFLKQFVNETCNRPEYEKKFIDAGCDDISLLEFIDDQQLENDIKIKIKFHRKMILQRIEEFKIECIEFSKWFNSKSHKKYDLSSILKNILIKKGILTWNSLMFVVKGDCSKLKKLLNTEDNNLVNVIWEQLKVISQHQNIQNESDNEGQNELTAYI